MNAKLHNVTKVTNYKYINLYDLHYKISNKDLHYNIVSRRSLQNISVNNAKKFIVDAVRIVPYIKKDNTIFVILIKEFRYPINNFIYSTPAGLIDKGETTMQAMERELNEEIGAKIISYDILLEPAYSSVGMTDESSMVYEAEVSLTNTQHLDAEEQIEYFYLPFKDILRFAKEQVLDMQAKACLELFYYKNKDSFLLV